MIDDLKKYIDAIVKKKLKANGGSYEKAGLPFSLHERKEQIDYSEWIKQLVNIDLDEYIPQGTKQKELLDFLCFDLLYKQSIKSLADSNHFAINEALEKLSVDNGNIATIINRISSFDVNKLGYFELFREEIEAGGDVLAGIHERVDAISMDSSQGNVVSHAAKMTNPICKYPRLFVSAQKRNDGYVRTGNTDAEFDLHINATKLKVFKFLSLMVGGRTMLELIRERDVTTIASAFNVAEDRASIWVDHFIICTSEQDVRTHPAIKQVYFPLPDEGYHQLSILQPSGLVFMLKQRVDTINDRSPRAFYGKRAKKENTYFEGGYSSIPDLTITRHGGDHPKNISGLNNKYQSYYLLPSGPPNIEKRDIYFPTVDFFSQSFSYYQCWDLFQILHELFISYRNDWYVRSERDEHYQEIIDRIIERMWLVRSASSKQYNLETSQLNRTQKIWLCVEHEDEREGEEGWLEALTDDIASFMFNGYKKVIGKKAFVFSDAEYKHIHALVVNNKEALR